MNMITIDRSVVQQGLEALVQIYQRAATAETQALSDAALLWSANADNTPESVRVEIQEVLWIRSSITALRAALAQQAEPEGSVCARCGALAFDPLVKQQAEPVAWRCACGANLYIDAQGRPASKAEQSAQSQQAPLMQEIARLHDRVKDLTLDVEFLSQPSQRKPLTDEAEPEGRCEDCGMKYCECGERK